MPSGSHGGSRGSHRSGGSRSSGGGGGRSYGGGGRHGGPSRPMRTWRFRFGRRRYFLAPVYVSKIMILFVVSLISAMFIFAGVMSYKSNNLYINQIQVDYAYYMDMISHAENDGCSGEHTYEGDCYMRLATITDHSYNDEVGKWFFDYEFELEDYDPRFYVTPPTTDGYTYSIFTRQELLQYPIDSVIEIAVNTKVVTDKTDSIPVLCKEYPLEADGEYIEAKEHRTTYIVMTAIASVVTGAIIVSQIVIIVKKKQVEISEGSTIVVTTPTSEVKICEYCGGSVEKGVTKCKSCGARVK